MSDCRQHRNSSIPAAPLKARLRLDLAFHAKAFPFNDHRLRVMQQPI
jgi:hypothetical protein